MLDKALRNLCLGELLGSGNTRDVYEWLPDPEYVIKVAKDVYGIRDNFLELDLSERVLVGLSMKTYVSGLHLLRRSQRTVYVCL